MQMIQILTLLIRQSPSLISAGNPQSATVFYLKTQNSTDADPTFKYDTKLIVDGLEITPQLTRAVDPQEAPLYIDKFGQQTTVPQDPAYILEGKGFPLYKADDLGAAVEVYTCEACFKGDRNYFGRRSICYNCNRSTIV